MDELSTYLLNGKSHASISPESLELMGKKAATAFLSDGVELDDSIAKLAGEYQDISPEQIKRVVEFANTAVYLAKHDQAKTAGADHSYPQFKLADAGRILQDLSDGARPTVVTNTDVDYSREAQKPKLSSAPLEAALAELFKTASSEEDYSTETIVHQLLSTKEMLTNLRDNLQDQYNQNESLFKEASAEFYDQAKRHLLDGGSYGDVVMAAKASGVEDETMNEVLLPIVKSLLKEKVAGVTALRDMAGREIDPDNILTRSFGATVMSGQEMQVLSTALQDVHQELEQVQDFIKKAYFSKEAFLGAVAKAGSSLLKGGVAAAKAHPISTAMDVGHAASGMLGKKQPPPVPPMGGM